MSGFALTGAIGFFSAFPAFYFFRKWAAGGKCESTVSLEGKTALITGANTGIGKETAVDFAKRGATVILACRDETRGNAARDDVIARSGNDKVYLKTLNLASLNSVKEFSHSFLDNFEDLHILVNNAGVLMCPYSKTEDGFEMQIGVNHFGHFALTNLLLPRLVESAPSRIVNVSSRAHTRLNVDIKFDDINSEKSYSKFLAYCQSKLANILFTKELNRKLIGKGVSVYAIHPGVVFTEISRHLGLGDLGMSIAGPLFMKSPSQGAQTTIYCAVQEGIEHQSGLYFSDCDVIASSANSCDEGKAKKLWELSEEMTGIQCPLS